MKFKKLLFLTGIAIQSNFLQAMNTSVRNQALPKPTPTTQKYAQANTAQKAVSSSQFQMPDLHIKGTATNLYNKATNIYKNIRYGAENFGANTHNRVVISADEVQTDEVLHAPSISLYDYKDTAAQPTFIKNQPTIKTLNNQPETHATKEILSSQQPQVQQQNSLSIAPRVTSQGSTLNYTSQGILINKPAVLTSNAVEIPDSQNNIISTAPKQKPLSFTQAPKKINTSFPSLQQTKTKKQSLKIVPLQEPSTKITSQESVTTEVVSGVSIEVENTTTLHETGKPAAVTASQPGVSIRSTIIPSNKITTKTYTYNENENIQSKHSTIVEEYSTSNNGRYYKETNNSWSARKFLNRAFNRLYQNDEPFTDIHNDVEYKDSFEAKQRTKKLSNAIFPEQTTPTPNNTQKVDSTSKPKKSVSFNAEVDELLYDRTTTAPLEESFSLRNSKNLNTSSVKARKFTQEEQILLEKPSVVTASEFEKLPSTEQSLYEKQGEIYYRKKQQVLNKDGWAEKYKINRTKRLDQEDKNEIEELAKEADQLNDKTQSPLFKEQKLRSLQEDLAAIEKKIIEYREKSKDPSPEVLVLEEVYMGLQEEIAQVEKAE